MALLNDEEIKPGLVAFLQPAILREDNRTETNAQRREDGYDHSVQDGHYFMLLMHFDEQRWLATPLFSEQRNERELLSETLKTGPKAKWVGQNSYWYPWQQWLLPVSAIIDASEDDEGSVGVRRGYAVRDRRALEKIAAPIVRNLTPFHRPNPKPLVSSD